MSSKLALKHKDSLALKENKSKHGEKQEVCKMKYRYLSLPCLTLSMFLVYWLIICPIMFAVCFSLFSFPHESLIFWIVSFLIWFVIMILILICWRCLQVKQNSEISVISKYGSDSVGRPLGVLQTSSEDAESLGTKIDLERDPESQKNDRESKKLLPLVIHKRISGENIEDTAVVHGERNGETRSDVASDYVAKNPLQDYLQLVTISPTKEEEVAPKTPMSPRDLFFIDLIRGAEEAEKANSSKSRTYFFPNETSENDTKNETNAEEGKNEDTEDRKDVKDEDSRDEKNRTSESSYFIANVNSPVSEKTEVFLHIDPDMSADPTEVIVEKPVLLLQSNEDNSTS